MVKTIVFAVSPQTVERRADVLHLRYLPFGSLTYHREVVGFGFVVVVFSPCAISFADRKEMKVREDLFNHLTADTSHVPNKTLVKKW